MTLSGFAQSIVLAYGWRRCAIAFIAGAVSVLATAPINLWPVMFLTLPAAVWLIDGSGSGRFGSLWSAAGIGWFFGFGYFLGGLYWTGYAFLVDAETFAWLLPFAVVGLPIGLAIFFAIGFALARLIWTHDATRVFSLAVALTASEWLRGHILTGFPWNALGYTLSEPLALAQMFSVIGLWGMTFLAVAVFASPATLIDDAPRRWLAPALGAVALVAMAAFGMVRLVALPTEQANGVKLRIMQPNLQQDVKFNYAAKQAVMNKYITLSEKNSGEAGNALAGTTLLIWPESAFPFFLSREPDALAQIADMLPTGTVLITGGVRPPPTPPGTSPPRAYNSVYVIDHDGTILSTYDKLHLVPFGEYLPFQSALESIGLQQLTKLQGGFIPGDRQRSISLARAPRVLPLICYEVIFPGAAVPRDDRPGWIVNLTNDGWFGLSAGPYQHLEQARMRAVEEGLPIVRAANTGISAIIDPVGRVTARLDLGTEGVLDGALPKALPPTLYARFGDIPAAIIVAGCGLLVLRRRGARPKR